jgi:lantibiotic leader peptide-processing serine protease
MTTQSLHQRLLFAVGSVALAATVLAAYPSTGNALAVSAAGQDEPPLFGVLIDPAYVATPDDVRAAIAAAGGTVVEEYLRIRLVIASSDSPDFASTVVGLSPAISGAFPNLELPVLGDPDEGSAEDVFVADDPLYYLQWSHQAINVPGAWALGARGQGVRVAVLDTSIDANHPDIAPNLNVALSRSFVPGQGFVTLPGEGDHGTTVGGTIAAADNNVGIIGVAPSAEIVFVKVLRSGSPGAMPFLAMIRGINYAADIGARVINMSWHVGPVPRSGTCPELPTPPTPGCVTEAQVASLEEAFAAVTQYAHDRGAVLVASGGNDALDFDHTADAITIPQLSPHVLRVSATSPIGWALNPATDPDVPTWYTNFGRSYIHFAAPAGTRDPALAASGQICTVGIRTDLCAEFDKVMTPRFGGWVFSWGTSQAAPHMSGVAALVIGRYPHLTPNQVRARIRAGADDILEPGHDAYSGHGRINAAKAVQ